MESKATVCSLKPSITLYCNEREEERLEDIDDRLTALSGSHHFSHSPNAMLHWRLPEGRKRLVLSYMPISTGDNGHLAALDGQEGLFVEVVLTSVCLAYPAVFEDELRNVHVLFVTQDASVHRVVLSGAFETQQVSLQSIDANLEGRKATLCHISDIDTVILGCSDGVLAHIDVPTASDATIVNLLMESNYMSQLSSIVRTPSKLLAVLGIREGVTSHDRMDECIDSPRQPVCIASLCFGSHVYVFAFCRDSRLRIWNLITKQCVKSVALRLAVGSTGSEAISTPSSVYEPHSSGAKTPLLPPVPLSALAVFDECVLGSRDDAFDPERLVFKLACFLPALSTGTGCSSFVVFQAAMDAMGQLSAFDPVLVKDSGSFGDEYLVDFVLAPYNQQIDPGNELSETQWWTLWTLWDKSCCSAVRFTQIHLSASLSEEEQEASASPSFLAGKRWVTAHNKGPEPVQLPSLDAFDDGLLEAVSYPELFLEHIFAPGRFSLYSIAAAVQHIGGTVPPAAYSSPSLLQQSVLSSVGASLETRVAATNAESYFADYQDALLGCYNSFLAIVVQKHNAESAPVALSYCASTDTIFTLQRGSSMGVLRVADTFEVLTPTSSSLSSLVDGQDSQSQSLPLFVLAPEDLFQGHLALLKRKAVRTDLYHYLRFIAFIDGEILSTSQKILIEQDILGSRVAHDSAIDDFASAVYGRVTAEMEASSLDWSEKLVQVQVLAKAIGHFQLVLATLLDAFRQIISDGSEMRLFDDSEGVLANNASVLTNKLVASSLVQIIHSRFQMVRKTLFALLILKNLNLGHHEFVISSSILRQFLELFGAYAKLDWISKQQVSSNRRQELKPRPTDAEKTSVDFVGRFSSLDLSQSQSTSDSSFVPLLVHLIQHHYIVELDVDLPSVGEQDVEMTETRDGESMFSDDKHGSISFPLKITNASYAFLDRLGFFQRGEESITKAFVKLAKKLIAFGHSSIVGSLFSGVERSTPAIDYLRGLVWLELREWDKAACSFERASSGCSGMHTDLPLVLPPDIFADGTPVKYYRHIVDLFLERNVLDMSVRFAKTCIALIPKGDVAKHQALVRTMNKLIFQSSIELADFESAHHAILANKDAKSQRDCLRTFVSALCDHSDLESLCSRFSFGNLSVEVERTLDFKARTGEVSLSQHKPNYHRICYTYFIFRGDYRSAALSMYTQSRKLMNLPLATHHSKADRADVVGRIVSEQAQSLLAALNSLSLVEEADSWIAVPAYLMVHPMKRRNTDNVNSDGLTQPLTRDGSLGCNKDEEGSMVHEVQNVQIVDVQTIRREYHQVLAKLQLSTRFPEVFQNTATLGINESLSMFCQAGMFESAFTFAKVFGLDYARIFRSIADRMSGTDVYVPMRLASSADVTEFGGDSRENRWSWLKSLLEQYDGVQHQFKYHLEVINAMFKKDANENIPLWLTTPFKTEFTDRLIRVYLKHDRIEDAVKWTVHYINEVPIFKSGLLND